MKMKVGNIREEENLYFIFFPISQETVTIIPISQEIVTIIPRIVQNESFKIFKNISANWLSSISKLSIAGF